MKFTINQMQLVLLKEALANISRENDSSISILENTKYRSDDERLEGQRAIDMLMAKRYLIDDMLYKVDGLIKED